MLSTDHEKDKAMKVHNIHRDKSVAATFSE